jgi:hypothetical protein
VHPHDVTRWTVRTPFILFCSENHHHILSQGGDLVPPHSPHIIMMTTHDDHDARRRFLDEEEPGANAPVWQTVLVAVTLAIMFLFMLKDWVGPDWVMITGLAIFMVAEIVDAKEGLQGFANEGILTVMALFVVAEGVSRTGCLDYYMGLILGKPKTTAGAQLRLTLPIATLSAFLNNTPIVAVGIPLTLRWAKSIQVPPQQLLIPLSYATILGGTCTLVGTSTNIVVNGKLKEDYPNEEAGNIGLLDLGVYGVPNALIGITYMLACAPFLLPFGAITSSAQVEDLLLGARVTPWSPSAGRTVKRSGLSDAGGIYLVNVKRGATGNVHHAVSRDFVLSVGDELYFTGRVEDFSVFCDKHGLEIITADNRIDHSYQDEVDKHHHHPHGEIGVSKEATFSTEETDRLRVINRLSDQIAGREAYENESRATRIIITADAFHSDGAVLVGVDTVDRAGLLMDISKTLFNQGLQLRHSEAKVVDDRSLSIWRCTTNDKSHPDLEEMWAMLHTLFKSSDQALVSKRSGIQVVRAVVTKNYTNRRL